MLSFFLSFLVHLGYSPEVTPKIYAGGDVMLSRGVGANFKIHWLQKFAKNYHPLSFATKKDFILLNLESPFSLPDKDRNQATFIFWANPNNAKILNWLKWEGTMVVSLANNHIMNRGFSGLEKTIETLEKNKIYYTGISKKTRKKFISLEKSGKKYCFWSYSYDGRSWLDTKTQTMWYVNKLSQSVDDVKEMNTEKCDYKIISLHWGREYKVTPTKYQRELWYMLVDNWATVVIGGHSHIFGEVEKYKGKYIFYSLGNFLFDQYWWGKWCQQNMDCIFDAKFGKKIVPTNIGTAVSLDFPYDTYKKWQWYMRAGFFEKKE